jgi:uncharacterized protein
MVSRAGRVVSSRPMAARSRAVAARRRLNWILALVVFGGAYLLIAFGYWFWQDRLVYFPGVPAGAPPPAAGLEVREEWIGTSDGERLHAWLSRPGGETKGAVLVCHGNGGNLAMRLPLAETFGAMGLAVLLFDYRGYGASSGKPSEEGTYLDAEAAHDFLAKATGIPPERITAYGESLGGAVAIELARRRKVGAVIVESAFTSMADIGSSIYPWLPVRLLLRSRYESAAKIGALGVPVLVIHSPEDDLIPFEHGKRLFAAASEPKRFLSTSGRHNDWGFSQRGEWRDQVREFLARGG